MTLRSERVKFHTDDVSLPRSGWCFWLVESNFPRSTTNQKHYQDLGSDALSVYGIYAFAPQSHYEGKPVVAWPFDKKKNPVKIRFRKTYIASKSVSFASLCWRNKKAFEYPWCKMLSANSSLLGCRWKTDRWTSVLGRRKGEVAFLPMGAGRAAIWDCN